MKMKTVVLKRIRGGYYENDVNTAFENLNLNDVSITKVDKLIFDQIKTHLFHFLVSVFHDGQTVLLLRKRLRNADYANKLDILSKTAT